MFTKLFGITVLGSLTVVGSTLLAQTALRPNSVVLSSDGKVSVAVPIPSPTTRTTEADAHDVADARAALTKARSEAAAALSQLTRTRNELTQMTRRLQRECETNNDLVQARKEVDEAIAAYQSVTAPILAELMKGADYRDASADLARAQNVSAEVSRSAAGMDERIEAAQAVLSAKTALAKLRQNAFGTNLEAVQAKCRCAQAALHLTEVQSQLERAIRQDPTYLAANQAVADARERAVAADQQVAAASQDLAAAEKQEADRLAAQQRFNDFLFKHGVSATPPQ